MVFGGNAKYVRVGNYYDADLLSCRVGIAIQVVKQKSRRNRMNVDESMSKDQDNLTS